MKRVIALLALAFILMIGVLFAVEQGSAFVLNPWVTGMLLLSGMSLLVAEMADDCAWGISGLASVICLGVVLAEHIIAGEHVWAGLLFLTAGLGLLIVEAVVLPGHGISALGGLASIFFGMFRILGAGYGTGLALVYSGLVAALSFAVMLAYISKDRRWIEMSRRLDVTTGCVGSHTVEPISLETSPTGRVMLQQVAQHADANMACDAIPEDTSAGPQSVTTAFALEDMRRKYNELKLSAVPAIEKETRISHACADCRSKLAALDQEARKALSQGLDDLAGDFLIRKEALQTRAENLCRQLDSAGVEAGTARQRISDFQNELEAVERITSDARARAQLSALKAQTERILDEGLSVVEHFEGIADLACAEAELTESPEITARASELAARKKRANQALENLKSELRRSDSSSNDSQQTLNTDHHTD